MKSKTLKTKAWPEGRKWPNELVLDVGSNMPCDVYGVSDNAFGVRYIRHDLVSKQIADIQKMVEALKQAQAKYRRRYASTIQEIPNTETPFDEALATETAQQHLTNKR